ncbi:MAG: GNAT family N-acetyltransferase [Vagococcus sp.]|uniref:GNAT family N-acetyltransferase n=1 Tax=Vagococcus sp. TaxID=1933889 RepID=UPI002FCC9BA7
MEINWGVPSDFNDVNQILIETATRLNKKGSSQWSHILIGEEKEDLARHLADKEVVVLTMEKEIIALAYLYQKPNTWDFGLWQLPFNENIYYLHKVAIKDAFVGKNYGKQFLQEIIKWVKLSGGTRICLDCQASVPYLNQFYAESGFTFKGKCEKGHFPELTADFNLYDYEITQ